MVASIKPHRDGQWTAAADGGTADFVADVFDHHAGWVDKLADETLPPYQGGDHMVLTLREPVGVVGAVIPWNAPLSLFAQKVAPALAVGCTIVLKPSEYEKLARELHHISPPPGAAGPRALTCPAHKSDYRSSAPLWLSVPNRSPTSAAVSPNSASVYWCAGQA